MVAAVGGCSGLRNWKMVIIIDGFIMTNCVLASRLYPEVLEYCIFRTPRGRGRAQTGA